jgi:hypothetical protein
MFADSFYVILLGLLVGIPTLLFLFLGLRAGHFNNLDLAAYTIFDEQDLKYVRPWESQQQKMQRMQQHGESLQSPTDWIKWL